MKMAESLLNTAAQVETKAVSFASLCGRRSEGKYLLCLYTITSFPNWKYPILGTYFMGKVCGPGQH